MRPHIAAAVAVPFLLLAIWADRQQAATPVAACQRFARYNLFTGVGLLASAVFAAVTPLRPH